MTEQPGANDALIEAVGTATKGMADLRENLQRQIDANKKSLRVTRIVGALIASLAVVGLGVGAGGVASAHSAHDAAHRAHADAERAQVALSAYKAETAGARIASCQQDNARQVAQAGAEKKEVRSLLALATANSTRPPDPRAGAAIRAILVGYDKTVDGAHALRDCSPAGIAAYLKFTGRP